MAQSLSRILVHIIFSTKHREPLITNVIKNKLFEYLGGICNEWGCPPIRIGGYTDHVHVLCMLSRKIPVMTLVENLKGGSSKWIKQISSEYEQFYWQDGYGVFSVSPKQASLVEEYITKQEEHHAKYDFKEEYMRFLKQYNIDYDERYLWD